jgi:uncharacterized protein (TIGR00255 family)
MTGYGRASLTFEKYILEIELRSVNSRYFDFKIKGPNELNFAQDIIKNEIHSKISRGKIEALLQCHVADSHADARIDKTQAETYYNDIKELSFFKPTLGDIGPSVIRPFDISKILLLPGAISKDSITENKTEDELKACILDLVKNALNELLSMKGFEGEKLTQAISSMENRLRTSLGEIKARTSNTQDLILKKYKERIEELLGAINVDSIDEGRILLEAAIIADKKSIEEEIVRMESHLAHLISLINAGGVVGKKLDFLMQEMNREVNTMGSKTDDIKVLEHVMSMKNDIENIREQVQNIE